MTRFLLTLEQSNELILKALEEGVGGEVFVRKIPAHSIKDLAEIMQAKGDKRKIIETGIRPGEKIHETLVSEAESRRTVEMGDYLIILPQIPFSAIDKKYGRMKRMSISRFATDTTQKLSKDQLRSILLKYKWIG